ncbi:hypothetical protein WJX84_001726 [Apatococcus fuscideae]|uniref:Uncharacterized protein n=1 Tax=Apatococcus fuscideae TaxID=2026836 RepID=A0AAW1RFX8_9CHLO
MLCQLLPCQVYGSAAQAGASPGVKLSEARQYNALRRDFTVNGLLYDPFQRLIYDYVEGLKDCQMRRLRTITDPHLSFQEDPARLLRCIRMSARCGLQITEKLGEAIREHAPTIATMNGSRAQLEVSKLVAYGAAQGSIQLLWHYGLLDIILPHHAAFLELHGTPRTETKASADSGLLESLALLDQHVRASDPFLPAPPALWVAALAAPLLVHSLQHPGQTMPWQSDDLGDLLAASSDSEDASGSDEDPFTKEDLFGEASTAAGTGDSDDDDAAVPSERGPPGLHSDPAPSRLQVVAEDLLDHLLGSMEVGKRKKGRRGKAQQASSTLSVLPQAQSSRVLSILLKHGHHLAQGGAGSSSRRHGRHGQDTPLLAKIFARLAQL